MAVLQVQKKIFESETIWVNTAGHNSGSEINFDSVLPLMTSTLTSIIAYMRIINVPNNRGFRTVECLNNDPGLMDTAKDDYQPQPSNPGIDAGDNSIFTIGDAIKNLSSTSLSS